MLIFPQNPLIQPVITPRFAPSCSDKLLKKLGQLAEEFDVAVQSHMCEQLPEVEYTLRLFPRHKHTADIFDTANLLTRKVGDSGLASHNGGITGHMQVTYT